MGLKLFSDSYVNHPSNIGATTRVVPHPNDPDPALFTIFELKQINGFVIGLVNYPNCKNYSGNKILVWEGRTVDSIKRQRLIDPHFLETDATLVARFIPNELGWRMAITLAEVSK